MCKHLHLHFSFGCSVEVSLSVHVNCYMYTKEVPFLFCFLLCILSHQDGAMFMLVCSGSIKSRHNLSHGVLETINHQCIATYFVLVYGISVNCATLLGIIWLLFCDFQTLILNKQDEK